MRDRFLFVAFLSVACAPEPRAVFGAPEPACSPIHGGDPGTRASPLLRARGRGTDTDLASQGRGRLVVRTYSAKDTMPIQSAHVSLQPYSGRRASAITNDSGYVVLEVPAGRYRLTA